MGFEDSKVASTQTSGASLEHGDVPRRFYKVSLLRRVGLPVSLHVLPKKTFSATAWESHPSLSIAGRLYPPGTTVLTADRWHGPELTGFFL